MQKYEKFEKEITIQFKNWKRQKIIWRWRNYDSMAEAMPLEDVSRYVLNW